MPRNTMTKRHALALLRERLGIESPAHLAILENVLDAVTETAFQAGVMEGKNCEPLREVGAKWYEKV